VLRDAPQYFDTEATLAKAIDLIEEAGGHDARLVVFPECWLPTHPYWSMDYRERDRFREIWAKYLWSSITVPGPETVALCEATRRTGTYLAIGINERDANFQGRMYNSILFLSPRGEILGVHRKICNTVNERFFHTQGDGGANLKTVFSTEIGKIGGSICGEHSQLLLLYNWMMQGIQVHCSLWPGGAGQGTTSDLKTRAFCSIAGVYGVLAATYIPEPACPRNFYASSLFSVPGGFRGGSGIVNPYGEYIAGPVYDQETIVYGDIDLADVDPSRYAVSLTGIYSRWDILSLNVSEAGYQPILPMAGARETADCGETVTEMTSRLKELEREVARLKTGRKDARKKSYPG